MKLVFEKRFYTSYNNLYQKETEKKRNQFTNNERKFRHVEKILKQDLLKENFFTSSYKKG